MLLGTFGIDDKTYILPTYEKGSGKINDPVEKFIQDIRDGKIIGYETKDEAEKQLLILRNTILNKERTGFAEGDIVDEPKFKNLNTEDKQESSISQENFRKAAENFKFKLRNELFTQQEGEAGYDYALKQNLSEGERSPFLKRLFKN